MSIIVRGTLIIRIVTGRFGDFPIAKLVTGIGEFSVRDRLLEQYSQGRYDGQFEITHICPFSYTTTGRIILEVRAKLAHIMLDNIDEDDQAFDQTVSVTTEQEPDPLQEEQPEATPQSIQVPQVSLDASPHSSDKTDDDDALFGELMPLGRQVKLDPTIDRSVLRQQIARLKALKYKYQPVEQVWIIV